MPQDYWVTELYREKYLKFSMWDGKETSDRKRYRGWDGIEDNIKVENVP